MSNSYGMGFLQDKINFVNFTDFDIKDYDGPSSYPIKKKLKMKLTRCKEIMYLPKEFEDDMSFYYKNFHDWFINSCRERECLLICDEIGDFVGILVYINNRNINKYNISEKVDPSHAYKICTIYIMEKWRRLEVGKILINTFTGYIKKKVDDKAVFYITVPVINEYVKNFLEECSFKLVNIKTKKADVEEKQTGIYSLNNAEYVLIH